MAGSTVADVSTSVEFPNADGGFGDGNLPARSRALSASVTGVRAVKEMTKLATISMTLTRRAICKNDFLMVVLRDRMAQGAKDN
jgi:hypothetical protein